MMMIISIDIQIYLFQFIKLQERVEMRDDDRNIKHGKSRDEELLHHKDKQKHRKRSRSSDDDRGKKKKKHHERSRSHQKKKKHKQRERERSNDKLKNKEYENLDEVIRDTQKRSEKKKKKKHSRSKSKRKEKKRRSDNQSIEKVQESRNKQRHRQKYRDSWEKQKQSPYRRRSRQKIKYRKRSRDYSADSDHRPRNNYNRRRDDYRNYDKNDRGGNYRRGDRRKDYRSKQNFRFDSPPKSDQSDNLSDDPEKMEKLAQLKAAQELVSSKADRKLYLGNLPPNINSKQLMDMLNEALKKMEINTEIQGDSIISAWISPDGVGHYAFVEFRSAKQATNGLALNGASLFGYQLKLGRPKQYIEYNKALLSQMGTDKNMETIIKKVATFGKEQLDQVQQRIVCPPSRIVVLKHIVSIEELGIDQQYQQILYDVTEMAKRFGEVVDVLIPRPHQIIDLQHAPKRVKGLGLIFIEYKTVSDAINARKQFTMKQFSGHPVACCYFNERRFREEKHDIQEKIVIDF